MNRLGTQDTFFVGISILIGGFSATYFSRSFVFICASIGILFTAILVLVLLKEKQNQKVMQEENTLPYLTILKNGIKYVISNKKLKYWILGSAFMNVAWMVWGTLMLFPLYFGYTGSDVLAGSLRSGIFFGGVIIQVLLANHTKKLKFNHLPKLLFAHFAGLFISVIVLLMFEPIENRFSLFGFVGIYVILTLTVSVLGPFFGTLMTRITVKFSCTNLYISCGLTGPFPVCI